MNTDAGEQEAGNVATTPGRSFKLSLVVAMVVLILDQVTKTLAQRRLTDGTFDLFWTVRFNLTTNSGMAFSRGRGFGPIIGVLALAVIVALLVTLRTEGSRLARVAVGAIIGGAIGNVADRLFRSGGGFLRGEVIDFIDFQWWPIFNVADIGVVLGGITLSLASLRHRAAA